ncbi:Bug family tripartite tricarboxylate transporter substrate binding protein [Variovorax sp.]|uniref:Bug family tripartite tricarboxylate transporter substrate binding protein n=1 Tax=Variovorax sp. TaxID=1871043 RepID=UPI002D6A9367|nr:tripartite tricarboxylate transporter substrate-binding protein [Variovorax sp.]HYP84062.1 tripartite tricarboxylate transporter substrate-binding protein [Variovorax sp.]
MNFTLSRRKALLAMLASTLSAGSVRAADAFPSRPVRLLVNYPPGGGTDIMARVLAEAMRDDLGQAVVVENRPGAGGAVGAAEVARSAADGHTVLVTAAGFVIGPSVLRSPGYDPAKDFVGVAQIAIVPLLVVVPPTSRFKTFQDVLAAGRRGESLSFASFGNATPSHLIGEAINHHAKISMLHVPYKGGMQALPDIVAGSVDLGLLDAVSMTPLVQQGRLRALAVTGPRRLPALPGLPTLVELGIPFDAVGWHGAFAPAGTPTAAVARLNAAFVKALARPDIHKRIVEGGSVPIEPPLTPAQWTAQARREVGQWAEAARMAGVEPA